MKLLNNEIKDCDTAKEQVYLKKVYAQYVEVLKK